MDTCALDMIDNAPNMPGSRAEALGLKPGDDKFKAVNLVTPRIQLRAAAKIGMGSMDYEVVTYEAVLTPENMGKHQIETFPTTLILRKHYQTSGHVIKDTGVEPFKRAVYSEGSWKVFDIATSQAAAAKE